MLGWAKSPGQPERVQPAWYGWWLQARCSALIVAYWLNGAVSSFRDVAPDWASIQQCFSCFGFSLAETKSRWWVCVPVLLWPPVLPVVCLVYRHPACLSTLSLLFHSILADGALMNCAGDPWLGGGILIKSTMEALFHFFVRAFNAHFFHFCRWSCSPAVSIRRNWTPPPKVSSIVWNVPF